MKGYYKSSGELAVNVCNSLNTVIDLEGSTGNNGWLTAGRAT
jgi:hypothetical protein